MWDGVASSRSVAGVPGRAGVSTGREEKEEE
jgi:hypothetical protein